MEMHNLAFFYIYLRKNGCCPIDVEFDCKTGQITALVVPGPGRLCSFFGRESEYVIPWKCICQIGDDIILVQIQEEKCFRKEHLT